MHTKALNICRTHDDPLWFLNALHHGFSPFHANQCFLFPKEFEAFNIFPNLLSMAMHWMMVFNRASFSLFLGREVANDVAH